MRILLVQPDSNRTCIGFKRLRRPEPLALETVAATVPDHEVRILDMRCDSDLVGAGAVPARLVGDHGFDGGGPHAQEICRTARQCWECTGGGGGHHVSMSPAEFDSPAWTSSRWVRQN